MDRGYSGQTTKIGNTIEVEKSFFYIFMKQNCIFFSGIIDEFSIIGPKIMCYRKELTV